MRVVIRMDVAEEVADEEHDSGLTEAGFVSLMAALAPYGFDIDIDRDLNDDA